MPLNIQFNQSSRNAIYIKLISIFRNCFFDNGKMMLRMTTNNFFKIFFIFLHNPYLNSTISDSTNDRSEFSNSFLDELNDTFDNIHESTNISIIETILDNLSSFKEILHKRKLIIEEVANKIWITTTSQYDDITIWVTSEKIIENDLINSMDPKTVHKSIYRINPKCIQYDFINKKFPPIILHFT